LGHFIFGLHQRLTLKFNTKPSIQSPKTSVKPFLGLQLVQNHGVIFVVNLNLYFTIFFVNIVSFLE